MTAGALWAKESKQVLREADKDAACLTEWAEEMSIKHREESRIMPKDFVLQGWVYEGVCSLVRWRRIRTGRGVWHRW